MIDMYNIYWLDINLETVFRTIVEGQCSSFIKNIQKSAEAWTKILVKN